MGKYCSRKDYLFMLIFVKEFYAKMTVIHLKKKDVVKSSVKGISIEFDHEQCVAILDVPGRTGICEYIKEEVEKIEEGMMMRRLQEEEAEGEDEGNRVDFDREAIIDEATVEGESGSGEKYYDAEEDAQGSQEALDEIPADATPGSIRAEGQGHSGVDPRVPLARSRLYEVSSEFERKRANKFHDELEKAKAENAKLLAFLHKTQTKPHP
ncbi:hypothetical protein Dimus_013830 [Dionaea muscipula]